MWNYVQYRQLGRKIEVEAGKHPDSAQQPWQNRRKQDTEGSSHAAIGNDSRINGDDKIVVSVEGDDDDLDPRNWPLLLRAKNIAILSFLIFTQAWAGAAASMANSAASKEFGVSQVAENLSTAMYLFGIGIGAFFGGPLSETIGRNPTYLIPSFFYLFFVLGTALTPTFGGQVVCRFFVGLFASATLSINGGSVADQFRPVKRAFVFPVIAWANVAGKPVLGSRWCS